MRHNIKTDQIQKLQDKMQGEIFEILVKSNILAHLSSSVKSKQPFFQFTRFYDFLCQELPDQSLSFLQAVTRLFKSKYLYIVVVDKESHHIQFVLKNDYDNLTLAEKLHYSIVPMEIVLNTMCLN